MSTSNLQGGNLIQRWYDVSTKDETSTDERMTLYSDTEKLATLIDQGAKDDSKINEVSTSLLESFNHHDTDKTHLLASWIGCHSIQKADRIGKDDPSNIDSFEGAIQPFHHLCRSILKHNDNIPEKTELEYIESSALKLNKIYKENKRKEIPFDLISSLATAELSLLSYIPLEDLLACRESSKQNCELINTFLISGLNSEVITYNQLNLNKLEDIIKFFGESDLSKLENLNLDFLNLKTLSKKDRANLKNSKTLEEDFYNLKFLSTQDCENLKKMTNLKALGLFNFRISDWSFLKNLSALKELTINRCWDSVAQETLKNMSGLETLNLSDCRISDWSFLKSLPHLRQLSIGRDMIGKLPSEILKEMPFLNTLNLSFSSVSIHDWSFLERFSQLKHLTITDYITDAVPVNFLKKLICLETLNLIPAYHAPGYTSDWSFLKNLPQLKELGISGKIIHEDILKELINLEALYLHSDFSKPPDWGFLKALKKLRHLSLVGFESISTEILKEISDLESLEMQYFKINLNFLNDSPNLKELSISNLILY